MRGSHSVCSPHRSGVPFNAPPFFYEGCTMCERKKREGKVTGNEGPMPDRIGWRRLRKQNDQAKFAAQAKRDREGRAAAKAVIPWR